MDQVLEAFQTGASMLGKALWALIFGYIFSAGIQVLVTREQMPKAPGERSAKQAGVAGFFGFISSSCSFAALGRFALGLGQRRSPGPKLCSVSQPLDRGHDHRAAAVGVRPAGNLQAAGLQVLHSRASRRTASQRHGSGETGSKLKMSRSRCGATEQDKRNDNGRMSNDGR